MEDQKSAVKSIKGLIKVKKFKCEDGCMFQYPIAGDADAVIATRLWVVRRGPFHFKIRCHKGKR